MQTTYLKIKLKSLAAEARIIKQQEQKMRGVNWGHRSRAFRDHRIEVVRYECRATHIAYGFLRGRTYHQIEQVTYPERKLYSEKALWDKVRSMVERYGSRELSYKIDAWRKGGTMVDLIAA